MKLEVSDGVGTIRLDRPPMNAIDQALTGDLLEAAREASERDDVGAVVLWGGEKVFAAGADIKMMAEMTPAQVAPMITGLQDTFSFVEQIPKVTIAAVNGFALGGGCELAMTADFRFAADNAQLGQPEILLGIIPGAGGTQRLPRLVGYSKAKEIIYSGRFVSAQESQQIGLVDEVYPADDVYAKAVEAAKRYASGARVALRAAKQAVHWGTKLDVPSGLIVEREAFISLFASEDQKEGMSSFLEKGPGKAQFKGR
ncbi:MAG: enoyl-CoA hydratase/isomerase family protein [Actinobacteria bacterium]|nr:enoyl-CoA hydratase/isomerase family protein [Actinomycetota bacterium]